MMECSTVEHLLKDSETSLKGHPWNRDTSLNRTLSKVSAAKIHVYKNYPGNEEPLQSDVLNSPKCVRKSYREVPLYIL